MPKTLDNTEQSTIDNAFDSSYEYSDSEGFEALDAILSSNKKMTEETSSKKLKTVSNGFNKTNTIPLILYTDSFTATQLTVLLGMIRYCMEKSAEGKSGENREFSLNIKIRNRSNSDFMFSIGDDSIPPIPNEETVYIGN